ncbi:MAG: T9SS type A sorting domain-containing protein, partial [Gemmatimonadetes bacterium]|nr:T9SS type A sorting domain-containing protein [Gemmatimonadota bacterium]
THSVVADGTTFSHSLWRSNCTLNTCSPQGGTWASPRAGWCPGDKAAPWNVDVTAAVTPGTTATLDYQIEAYENLCRPNNPTCVAGVTCTDCNYNTTGHTEPHYTIHGTAILWKPRANVVSVDLTDLRDASGVELAQNAPNPFSPRTTFEYTIAAAADVELMIYSAAGRLVVDEARIHGTPGTYRYPWDGRDADGRPVAAGVYFYSVRVDGETQTRKMIRVR